MIGRTISHYRILEELGEGGMGVVYKAHDTTLDRAVALKFLPQRPAAADEDMQRFVREAKAAAALNHPNICTIYAVEEHEGRQFISMEYVDGVTLREKCGARGRPALSSAEAIAYAIDIAEALSEAHEKGIVHRDVKPENIMVDSKNRIKVMDFGLAKSKDVSSLTKAGTTVGTIAYMPPEQIQGQDVDQRSDIFSFGVVLYEMLAGQTPFRGEHEAAMMYSIVNEEPQPISSFVPDISSPLENLIERTLEKDPSDRYQSMRDLLSDLRRLKRKTSKKIATRLDTSFAAAAAPERRRLQSARPRLFKRSPIVYLAVAIVLAIAGAAAFAIFHLPKKSDAPPLKRDRVFVAAFENRTGDPALDPIGRLVSDWITQGILNNELGEAMPTTTTLPLMESAGLVGGEFKDRAKLVELAEKTHASILVAGMYYQVAEDIQFEAQIIDAQMDEVILTLERVRGPRSEPMKAINDLQQKILGALAIRMQADSDLRVISEPPVYEAYVEYYEGTRRYFGVDYEKALEHYRRAIEIDPRYAAPKLRMMVAYGNMEQWATADSIMQSIDRERDRLSPFERYMLDWFKFYLQGRLEESFAALLHTESLAPRDAVVNYLVGLYARNLNRPAKTVETYEKLDWPVHWVTSVALSWRLGVLSTAYHLLENYEKELETAREAQKHFPNDLYRRADEIRALAALGRVEELLNVVEKSKDLAPTDGSAGNVMSVASLELRAHGHKVEALKIAEEAVRWHEGHDAGDKEGLAEALYHAERWDEAYALFKELAAERPNDVGNKGMLGVSAARKGDEREARRIADELKGVDQKYLFGGHTYNRACIHALLGEHAEAVRLLKESFEQGRRFNVYIHRDIDFESMRDYPPFQELLKPKG